MVPDNDVFPYASGRMDPRPDFRTELTLFADSIFREDRSVVDLLRASHTYLNERLALQYGINDVKGDEFRRVELKDSARWGLLGKGAILMAAAYPNRTSPVLRGSFILKYLRGVPPAKPPTGVPTLNDKDIGTTKALTVREMMAKHRASPTCSACHAVMDPLGFALENFDATGMWRDKDRFAGTAIDSAGELPDGTKINGPDDLRKALLRRPEQFVQTFVENLLTYAMGRTREYYDMPTVRRIVRDTAAKDYKFSAIVQAVVNSEQFKMRRVPQPVQSASTPVLSGANKETPSCSYPKNTFHAVTVLQGIGATIALPLLEAMFPAATASAANSRREDPETLRLRGLPARRDHGSLVAEGNRHGLHHVADPRAPGAVPQASDHRLRPAQQARGNARTPRLYRARLADLREALGLRQGRSGLRRELRPDRRPLHRTGHASPVARAHRRPGQRPPGMAHADPVACRRKATRARSSRSSSDRATPIRNAPRSWRKPAVSSIA